MRLTNFGPAVAALCIVFAVAIPGLAGFAATQQPETVVDADGKLHVPMNYRTSYQLLGSWAIADGEAHGSKEMHVVYASPGTIEAYRKDGHFPDGAVLIKEVFQTASKQMTTGFVSRADVLKGWFVMVKDSKGSYPDNKLWGDGWGWSWFDAATPTQTSSVNYRTNCQACHIPAKGSDWIYVDGYPTLKP